MFSQRKSWDWFFRSIKSIQSSNKKLVEIRAVFVRSTGDWMHYATCLFIPTDDTPNGSSSPKQSIFNDLALVRKVVPIEDISNADQLKKTITIWDDLHYLQPIIELAKDISPYFYCRFNEYDEFPIWRFDLTGKTGSHQSEPEGPFIHPDLPPYLSVAEAAAEWLRDMSILRNNYPIYPYLCILKSSMGWFEDIRVNENKKLFIQLKMPADPNGWTVKLVAKGFVDTIRATKTAQPNIIFEIPSDVKEMTLFLIDNNSEFHDFFSETPYRSSWPRSILSPGITIGEQDLLKMIHRGEGQTLEFKEWLPITEDKKKRWELHRAVVAFANTKGGTILVGVNNDGEIIGIKHNLQQTYSSKGKKNPLNLYESEIRHALGHEITPEIEVSFNLIEMGSQHVLAIHINEGKAKPYRLINSGEYFIRSGANNLRPTPEELKQLLCDKPFPSVSIG